MSLKIMLAISDHWVCDARIDALATWTLKLEREVLCVHVAPGGMQPEHIETPGEKVLRDITARIAKINPNVQSLLLFATDIAEALNKTISEHRVSLLVMGLSRQGLLERLIEGNIPRAIFAQCQIPILALPANWDGVI
jgi:nucleotide-binding universal stress UspA family protein